MRKRKKIEARIIEDAQLAISCEGSTRFKREIPALGRRGTHASGSHGGSVDTNAWMEPCVDEKIQGPCWSCWSPLTPLDSLMDCIFLLCIPSATIPMMDLWLIRYNASYAVFSLSQASWDHCFFSWCFCPLPTHYVLTCSFFSSLSLLCFHFPSLYVVLSPVSRVCVLCITWVCV